MKHIYLKSGIILLFIAMLVFPGQVFEGASSGLLLWFNSVLPTLLPFIIISSLLIRTHAIDWIVRVTGPVLCRIFRVTPYGSFAVAAGFLCGYPMGSKVTTDLLMEGHIDLTEAGYLLSFCNNASPIFIISYIVLQNLSDETLLLPALIILMSAPVLASFLFRFFLQKNNNQNSKIRSSEHTQYITPFSRNPSSGYAEDLIDTCIMDGFETITKIGGYMMLFSILLSLAQLLNTEGFLCRLLFLPSLEITNGISLLCRSTSSEPLRFFFCMACTSFGGWCAAAQTHSVIARTGLSIKPYIVQKLVTAMVTSLLTYLYLHFIH